MNVCRECKHLIDPAEVHECPSEEYTKQRNALVNDACEAEKVFTDYDLENYTRDYDTQHDNSYRGDRI